MTTEHKLRDCICADPENCTQAVPGYRCRKSRSSQPPTSDDGALAKNRYADTLNALVEMQESMAYAVRRSVLKSAEEAIVELERTLHAKERELADQARMVHDFPRLMEFYSKHALGGRVEPSCLKCGQQRYHEAAIKHMELPNIYLCSQCATLQSAAATPRDALIALHMESLVTIKDGETKP